jgi:hypothetical protein
MEYREKQYRVMLGIDSQWKCSVDGHRRLHEIRQSTEHYADGVKAAERAIDKALAPKKQRLKRPE